ncbi:MAG: RdgB/HAM1 family non-canonical purine NTP pyrophosphatase [Alphaproteobacteria bacterium]|nr:RdgB/HAM1 family non-canonical purine NTP pyrophosphatase [Alphaproteobacteria bacterium]MBR5130897.1 RdgB/HAM1 family non-canonical purine NTP pyrophosphatase [Alphaproteobacteria bacterium]
MKKIIFATHNEHKLSEVRQILEPLGYKVLSAGDLNLPDVEETGMTFKDNALLKAYAGYKHTSLPVLAEDTGLCIHALGDEPGIYTKRYAEQHGGFPKVFDVLAERMKDNPDKSAYFNCTMALVIDETQAEVFEGIFRGDILPAPRGVNGFGYDPVFVPKGYDKTVAELSEDEKNTISHRALALKKVADFLSKNNHIL